jgi:hypothetical protein
MFHIPITILSVIAIVSVGYALFKIDCDPLIAVVGGAMAVFLARLASVIAKRWADAGPQQMRG